MVDVDSQKWRQYAETSSGLARLVYAREGRALLALERRAAMSADAVIFVSRAEAELFKTLVPDVGGRTHFVNNGVDTDHFDPSKDFPNPFGTRPAVVFTGAMNYRPNVQAMSWFSEHVMPLLRQHPKSPCLWIVGSNPSPAVLALAGPDVRVTGRVPDTRPYLRHAAAVVAPLQIARGVQNKVLEAMAMAAAIVVTPRVREGLEQCADDELLTAAAPADFAAASGRILDGAAGPIGERARARVVHDYTWRSSLSSLDRIIEPGLVRVAPAMAVSSADAVNATA
jgi:sugar transferase (PEP-CTERM/EpsH1 system associated)